MNEAKIAAELQTPCGNITIKKNKMNIPFEIKENTYDAIWISDEKTEKEILVRPDGCKEIFIDLAELSKGDVLVCTLEPAEIESFDDNEKLICAGKINDFEIGMSAPNTKILEQRYVEVKDDLQDFNKTERYLCYECAQSKGGYTITIVDDPLQYQDRALRKAVILPVVWCSSEKSYAKEIVKNLIS